MSVRTFCKWGILAGSLFMFVAVVIWFVTDLTGHKASADWSWWNIAAFASLGIGQTLVYLSFIVDAKRLELEALERLRLTRARLAGDTDQGTCPDN